MMKVMFYDYVQDSTCQDGFFKCLSGRCLPNDRVCDGYVDCVHSEDEDSCGKVI